MTGGAVDFVPPELAGMLGLPIKRKLEEAADPPPSKAKEPAAPEGFIPPELAGMFGMATASSSSSASSSASSSSAPAADPAAAEEMWVPPELRGLGLFAQRPAVRSAGAGLFADDDATPNDIASIFSSNDM